MPDNAVILRTAMDAQKVTDNDTRAGLAAICMGESHMQGYVERGYAHTSNERIRQVFGERVAALSDAELDDLKSDDRAFFNQVYGGAWGARNLGNTQPDDGYNFRGRGFIQLTGRSNYQRYANKTGHGEIMDNPGLANDPEIAAQLAVAYILDRYHGGGFEAMLRCVGNNTPDIAFTKAQYYHQFVESGEFNYDPNAPAPSQPAATVAPYPIHQQVAVAGLVPSTCGLAVWIAAVKGIHIPAEVIGDLFGVVTGCASLFVHWAWGKRGPK